MTLKEHYTVEVQGDHAHIVSEQGHFSLKVYSHGQCTVQQMEEFAEPIAAFLNLLIEMKVIP
jgi:hypothetical protein